MTVVDCLHNVRLSSMKLIFMFTVLETFCRRIEIIKQIIHQTIVLLHSVCRLNMHKKI